MTVRFPDIPGGNCSFGLRFPGAASPKRGSYSPSPCSRAVLYFKDSCIPRFVYRAVSTLNRMSGEEETGGKSKQKAHPRRSIPPLPILRSGARTFRVAGGPEPPPGDGSGLTTRDHRQKILLGVVRPADEGNDFLHTRKPLLEAALLKSVSSLIAGRHSRPGNVAF